MARRRISTPASDDRPINSDHDALTPKHIVYELDRYIVGQEPAKRAVAVAMRNRYRRTQVAIEFRDEITPKNIMLIGPTGVGKTEIARRLAKLANAPFLKVEATKFTEVGYVGRDVESIARDLAEAAVTMVHEARLAEVQGKAEEEANEKLISLVMRALDDAPAGDSSDDPVMIARPRARTEQTKIRRRRRTVAKMLADRQLEEQVVEIEVESDESFSSAIEFFAGINADDAGETVQDWLSHMKLDRKRLRQLPVSEARQVLIQEEAGKLVDWESVVDSAIERAEQTGIVFLDEIDKIVGRGSESGPDVSGEGVQRDLLPIVEGSTVQTRYGGFKTDHVLFIAAGAFHRVKPSDLLPELQGRFPLRVELTPLNEEDFVRILTTPDNALSKQYQLLLAVEGVTLEFTEDGLREIAHIAADLNDRTENIGARRLHTVVEKVLEDLSFNATDFSGQTVVVTRDYVRDHVASIAADDDLSKFIL